MYNKNLAGIALRTFRKSFDGIIVVAVGHDIRSFELN